MDALLHSLTMTRVCRSPLLFLPGLLLSPDAAGPVLPNDGRLPGVLRCMDAVVLGIPVGMQSGTSNPQAANMA